MPVQTSYPGVYVEEIPSGVRTITGVATSLTAFVGRTPMGPVGEPTIVTSYADFERTFGGIATGFTLGFAVRDFFMNGGGQGIIVRLVKQPPSPSSAVSTGATPPAPSPPTPVPVSPAPAPPPPAPVSPGPATPPALPDPKGPATAAVIDVPGSTFDVKTAKEGAASKFILNAASPGAWGAGLRAVVDYGTKEKPTGPLRSTFNLTISQVDTATGRTLNTESFLNVSRNPQDSRYVKKVLANNSALVTVSDEWAGVLPAPTALDAVTGKAIALQPDPDPKKNELGLDGGSLVDADYLGSEADKTGLYSLEHTDLFNLLCIPADDPAGDQSAAVLTAAAAYCEKRRAMLLVDPPTGWTTMQKAMNGLDAFISPIGVDSRRNAALFFPRITEANPVSDGQLQDFPPSGAIAGIFARTDSQRGVWKAPAGLDASFNGVSQMAVRLTDGENGFLNPLGINCLRSFPVIGPIIWGARTLAGADILEDDYKYIPVRRLALYIEESLYRGTQWIVFEPNDEPLWSQIRLNIGSFMHGLFRQGAFQGSSPTDAYFVKCDKETTTQNDINAGVVNIIVGFAPLKPAEFVVIQIEQMAGQIQT